MLFDSGVEKSWILDDGTPVVGTPDEESPNGGLNCAYPSMKEWEPCYSVDNRGCWLKKTGTEEYIDINTDYENPWNTPNGTVRKVMATNCSHWNRFLGQYEANGCIVPPGDLRTAHSPRWGYHGAREDLF